MLIKKMRARPNRPWSHDTPEDLRPNDYSRAMSYMYVAKFADMCIDRCRIVHKGISTPELSSGDKACIDTCFQEIKSSYTRIYKEYKEAVEGFFE